MAEVRRLGKYAKSVSDAEEGYGGLAQQMDTKKLSNTSKLEAEATAWISDQDRDISDGPFSSYCTDSAHIWKLYMDQARAYDDELSSLLNSDLDPLLIFAGLFSAILSAFLIEVRKGLQEDSQDVTNKLLRIIQSQLNTTHPMPITSLPFHPTSSTRWVNGLWFSSLIVSLMSALGASLAKGWVAQFASAASGVNWRDVFTRHRRFMGIQRWRLQLIIQSLPVLIHIAFFLFAAGLIVLLLGDDAQIGAVILSLLIVIISLYLGSTLHPIFSSDSPFRTPISSLIVWLTTRRVSSEKDKNALRETDTQKAQALAWLLEETSDTRVIDTCVQAVAGLPAIPSIQDELYQVSVASILLRGITESEAAYATDKLIAYLYAALRLVQCIPSEPVDNLTSSILMSLAKTGGTLEKCHSHRGRGIKELSISVRARIFLFLFHHSEDTAFWETDIHTLIQSCPETHARYLLTEVSLLRKEGSVFEHLQSKDLSIRSNARKELRKEAKKVTLRQLCIEKFGVETIIQGLCHGPGVARDEFANKLLLFAKYRNFRQRVIEQGGIVRLARLLQTLSGSENHEIRVRIVSFMNSLETDVSKALSDKPHLADMVELWGIGDIGIYSSAVDIINGWCKSGVIEIVSPLLPRLRDNDLEIRKIALSGLLTFLECGNARTLLLEQDFIKIIEDLMTDINFQIRQQVNLAILKLFKNVEYRTLLLKRGFFKLLLGLLLKDDRQIRQESIRALFKIVEIFDDPFILLQEQGLLKTLLNLLTDRDQHIRMDTMWAFMKLFENVKTHASLLVHEVFIALVRNLSDQDHYVRLHTMWSLIKLFEIDDARAFLLERRFIPILVNMLQQSEPNDRQQVYQALMQLLDRVGGQTLTIKQTLGVALMQALKAPIAEVRQEIIKTLMRLFENDDTRFLLLEQGFVDALVSLQQDNALNVRLEVIQSLMRLFEHDDTRTLLLEQGFMPILVNMLKDPSLQVRQHVYSALMKQIDNDDVRTLLVNGTIDSTVFFLTNLGFDHRLQLTWAVMQLYQKLQEPTHYDDRDQREGLMLLIVGMLTSQIWHVRFGVIKAVIQLLEQVLRNYSSQLRTGHIALAQYLCRFKRSDTPTCPACQRHEETVDHYLLQCPAYDTERENLKRALGTSIGPPKQMLLSDPKALPHLIRYINATGRLKDTHGALSTEVESVYRERKRVIESFAERPKRKARNAY